MKRKVVIHWFRRDLRLHDNTALNAAAATGLPVLPVFIFDTDILAGLAPDDKRVSFIYSTLKALNSELCRNGSSMHIYKGVPVQVFEQLLEQFDVRAVFTNRDYEPYAVRRDEAVASLTHKRSIPFQTFKDHVIFERLEIRTDSGGPYTVFTPYKRKWISLCRPNLFSVSPAVWPSIFLNTLDRDFPELDTLGFTCNLPFVPEANLSAEKLSSYKKLREHPGANGTTNLSVYLRFGLISVRDAARAAIDQSEALLSELIWREFFIQILANYPHVETSCFRKQYENVEWRNNEDEFDAWCKGQTGYPLVDAGMRQLNSTGLMHNRVRMVVASFLCKHLLIDWRWGEAYFASKLLDYELASNNGNWQWSAGCGCDAAPYFRIFNPHTQALRFDPDLTYVRRWIPEYDSEFPRPPIVDHKLARERALAAYQKAFGV